MKTSSPAGSVADDGFLPIERRILSLTAGDQRGFLILRLMLSSALALHALEAAAGAAWGARLCALPALYAAAAWLLYRLRRAGRLSDELNLASFLLDVAVVLAVLLIAGKGGSDAYMAVLVLVLGSCLLQRPLLIVAVSASACAAYALLAFPPSVDDFMRVFFMRLSLLLLIALFAVFIADYAAQIERRTARRYEERLAWMQRLSMVGKAMAAVLHEAKTPLGTVVLSAEAAAEAVREGKDPGPDLRVIGQEADHAAAVLQNFLDFVKPGRLERRPLSLLEPLRRALEMAKVRLDERGVEAALDVRNNCEVLGSRRHLVQAFTNVIHNAVDAMPSGGRLSVLVESRRTEARVVFQDTGTGMSREALERVFEPFSTSKTDEEGHGLGLGIVRWILQEHDGEVAVHSDGPGRGSRVTLVLPLAGREPRRAEPSLGL